MSLLLGLYTKHAARCPLDRHHSMEEAKEVHRCLKVSAGMFLGIKENLLPRLPASPEKGVDSDPRVVEAYAQQSQGEAQEGEYIYHSLISLFIFTEYSLLYCLTVTLARALELGHKPAVVYALSSETSKLFTVAGEQQWLNPSHHYLSLPTADSLKTLDPSQFAKWTVYLQLKATFYESYVREHCTDYNHSSLSFSDRHTVS